jgi:hypothetical protein
LRCFLLFKAAVEVQRIMGPGLLEQKKTKATKQLIWARAPQGVIEIGAEHCADTLVPLVRLVLAELVHSR